MCGCGLVGVGVCLGVSIDSTSRGVSTVGVSVGVSCCSLIG